MPTLNWIGKEKVINHHQDVPFRVLEHKYGFIADPVAGNATESEVPTNSGNKIIHGDNLEALKSLLPEYEGKVKCIYIDPPYNTGNESWVYNDNVNHPKIKKWLGEVVGKDGEDLTRHDKWLCMMYPRLKLLHKLLVDDGAIFISIDDNEQANLKLICDEIFGTRNFVGDIIWQHSIQGKNDAKKISLHHNHTLIYGKNNFQIGRLKRTSEHNKAYSNPDNDPNGEWRAGDVRSPNYRENLVYDIKSPSGKIINAPEIGWRWSSDKMEEKIKSKEIIFNSEETKITRKIYLNRQKGRVVESLWFGNEVGTTREANKTLKMIFNNNVPFDTPKPPRLIERILHIASDKNTIVLDSFAGSGTTAHAVMNLNKQDGGNRKFILVEMEDYANDITAERVKRVAKGYGTDKKAVEGIGGSFDYYELGLPLFKADEMLNEEVGTEKIREYIWYSETRTPYSKPETEEFLLGKTDDAVYYFIYEKDRLTTLDYDSLSKIKTKGELYIIYADNCLLPKEFMDRENIIFKKIPRDITRF
ncbi:site-specific DNA-methyltransferase [bacterium]|nr:MAG: site-specific DNA-methyltransferase [bacterium]